jgi:hypothetical protein
MTEVQQVPVVPVESQGPPQQSLRPHRGGLILALGILGIVCCFICGIIAWVMGNNDMREMDAGRMDPSGRGLTQAGKICGMVSVILQIIGLVMGFLMMLLSIGMQVPTMR